MNNHIIWGQELGKKECPYLKRWVFDFKLFSIRIHHWTSGDDPRFFHDHPWDLLVFVLKGSYTDISPSGREHMPAGKMCIRKAEHRHTVETSGCCTILLCGPVKRIWGFWLKNKSGKDIWFKAKRFFLKYGQHQCENS